MTKNKKWFLVLDNLGQGEKQEEGSGQNNWLLYVLVVMSIGFLASRAFFLQVILGGKNAVLAEGNRIEIASIGADRGVIEDRNGVILARNGLSEDGKTIREYPFGEYVAHALGYVGEISQEELTKCADSGCRLGLIVGKMGLEKEYDLELRGSAGEELVETNARGERLRVLGRKEPSGGSKLVLNLDVELQKLIVGVMREREEEKMTRGSAIVSGINGEVFALVSWPSFDSNLFSGMKKDSKQEEQIEDILTDTENKPMFNRALSAVYPPGSVYKLVTAVAGLESGAIDRATTVEDTGEIKIGEYRYGNWYFDQYGSKEGVVDLSRALARSNDIYFYKAGEWIGIDRLVEWTKKFGLGSQTGVDLPGEVQGLVPDPIWKERRTGERWFLGNTYHMSIGQGDLLVTPIQVSKMTAEVISGKKCPINLVQKKDQDSKCEKLDVSRETREAVLAGMKGACSQGGTAFPFFDFSKQVACKTGTAQHGGEKTLPHSWITVVVPQGDGGKLEDYEDGVVITVMLEEAGEGSAEAGPIARKIADYLLEHPMNLNVQ